MPEKFRGSSEIPLTPEGLDAAHKLGQNLAARGGLDEIMTSNLGRTRTTAQAVAKYTHAPITYSGDALHPWHLGGMEGQDITPERLAFQKTLIHDTPDTVIAGRGPLSTADGESFNQFKQRTQPMLARLAGVIAADPSKKIGVVTHYRVKKLLDSWVKNGMPPNGEIDPDEMTSHSPSDSPGGVDRFSYRPDGTPTITNEDTQATSPLPGGVYFLRHEATPWNATSGS